MIGKTNSQTGSTIKTENVNIRLASNQSSSSDINGATVTLAYGSYSKTYTWSGTEITTSVPEHVTYTLTFSDVSGYKKPSVVTNTAVGGNSRSIVGTYQTQLLTVNVVGSGATPSGYTITVKNKSTGAVIGTQTTSSKVYKIPYGVNYIVSAGALTGYNAVTDQEGNSNSQSNSITVTYVYNPTVDLSKQNIYGESTSMTTANCYVVSTAGAYMFPLVYGNAFSNGKVNSAAYTKAPGTYSNSHDFVNHLDDVITSPFIENHDGCMAESVELSMADTDGIFSGLEIVEGGNCRYVKFTISSIPSTGANGVISILDANGVVIWSWHIWVWPDDLTPVVITNNTGVDYSILPVNLATKKSTTAGKMYNWFYQWGRPTPMLPPNDYNSTTNATNYGTKTFAVSSAKADTYGAGIQNPQMFYKGSSSPYNWFGAASYYNLWDANCVSTGNSDNDVVKTVYDPCPPGFKMPNGNTFTYFSTSNVVGSFNNGWYFKRNAEDTTGVFFPASGYRYYSDGSLYSVGSYGYAWPSSAYSQNSAYYLSFSSSSVDPQNYDTRSYGYSVRPVQE